MAVTTPAGGSLSALRRWGLWVLVAVAIVAALAIGSSRHSPRTLDQRTRAVAGQVRCPVCSGESAADSQDPAAVAIRAQIRQELSADTPPGRVLADLVRVYGTGILEKPQARGVGLLVWIIPVIFVVGAAAGLGLAFDQWRRQSGRPPRGAAGGAAAAAGAAAGRVKARPEDQAIVAEALAAQRPPNPS